MKLLLHACCGPCSLEPVRVLREAGHELSIAYVNSNIHPREEYEHRLATLQSWAEPEGIAVIEGSYLPCAWEDAVGVVGDAALRAADFDVERCAMNPACREARCRACYRLRFEETARMAREQGFDAIGTTLSVSPFQFTDIIREELDRAARNADVQSLFEDYRPFYDEATKRSRALGMYRQNYCGCRFSDVEAAAERAVRKRERTARKEAQLMARAEEIAAAEAARAANRASKAAYASKQEKKHSLLRQLRLERKKDASQ